MDTASKVSVNQNSPLVSIIMLTYNRAGYIAEAIESALTQTYQNFELIIIDDGSTDNTKEVVHGFTDTRIRYIHDSVNKGLYARRAESLSYVNGAYVAILDSDDAWSSSEKLAEQVAFMETNPECAVVGTFITLIDSAGNQIGTNEYHTSDTAIRRHMLPRCQFANSSVLMRKSALDTTTGYQQFAPAEDMELFLQLGRIGSFANIPKYYLNYRIHPGSESARKAKHAKQVLKVIRLHQSHYPGVFKATLKMYLLILLARLGLK